MASPKRRRVSSALDVEALAVDDSNAVEVICLDSDDDDVIVMTDVDDVSIVPIEPLPVANGASHDELTLGDVEGDGDAVASAVLRTATVYPHARADCKQFPFCLDKTNTAHDLNLKRCEKCYCFVCDVEAAKCCDWMSHCMASDKRTAWRSLREKRRKKKNVPLSVPSILMPPRLRASASKAGGTNGRRGSSASGVRGNVRTPGETLSAARIGGPQPVRMRAKKHPGDAAERRNAFVRRINGDPVGHPQQNSDAVAEKTPLDCVPRMRRGYSICRARTSGRPYLTVSSPESFLIGKIDFFLPCCSHRQANFPLNFLGPQDDSVVYSCGPPCGGKLGIDILAREAGLPYEDRWHSSKKAELMKTFLRTEETGIANELFSKNCWSGPIMMKSDKSVIDGSIPRALARLVESGCVQVRWEHSHHEGYEQLNQSGALSVVHPGLLPPSTSTDAFQKMAKATLEWNERCMARGDKFESWTEQNCCVLRAWVHLRPKAFSGNNVSVASLSSERGTPASYRTCLDHHSALFGVPDGVSVDPAPNWNHVFDLGRVLPLVDFADFTKCAPSASPTAFLRKSYDSPLMKPLFRGSLREDEEVRQSYEDIYASEHALIGGNGPGVPKLFSLSGILTSPVFTVSDGLQIGRAEQPSSLTVPLRPYQLETLQWMFSQESKSSISDTFWVKLTMIPCVGSKPTRPTREPHWIPFWYSPLTGNVSRSPPPKVCGGVLCEEMGLGKTVEVIGLIAETLSDARGRPKCGLGTSDSPLHIKATLILTPVSLLYQWQAELKARTRTGTLNVCAWYGSNRANDPRALADYDVILTTYSTMASRGSSACLEAINFYRIVIDESTYVRDGNVAALYRSLLNIKSRRRWAVSGTPFGNNIRSFIPILRYIGVSPFSSERVSGPLCAALNARLAGQIVFPRGSQEMYSSSVLPGWPIPTLAFLMKTIMIRHVKNQQFDGGPLLDLPTSAGQLVMVDLCPEERVAYNDVERNAVQSVSSFLATERGVNSNIINLHSILQRVRMASCGIYKNEETVWVSEGSSQRQQVVRLAPYSAKAVQVVRDIKDLLVRDTCSKFVVFAEYAELRARVERELRSARIGVCGLTGSMNANIRGRVLSRFASSDSESVLLLSLKNAHGLSLTCANVVILTEPSMSQESELQACHRVIRIGQTRHTKVLSYVARNTVDERIVRVRMMKGQAPVVGEPSTPGGNEQLSHRIIFSNYFNVPYQE